MQYIPCESDKSQAEASYEGSSISCNEHCSKGTPEVQSSCTGCTGRRSFRRHHAGRHVLRRAGSDYRLLLEQFLKIERNARGRGVDVDLQNCHHQANGRQRKQQLEQHGLLVSACRDTFTTVCANTDFALSSCWESSPFSSAGKRLTE